MGQNVQVLLGLTAFLCGGYLYCVAPNRSRKERMKVLEQQYIAHRGLFDNKTNRPENSLPAFQNAVDHGYGIELDVQLTSDGKLVVFHDETLTRMCGVSKRLYECTFEELQGYSLLDSGEKIPLYEDVLKIVDGKVPMIVEVKGEGDWKNATRIMAEMMDDYKGYYVMESFHPLSVKWFKDHRPDVIRGQLSTDYFGDHSKKKWFEKFLLTNLFFNFLTRPDFIAYNQKWKNNWSYRIIRSVFPVENVAWTVRSKEELTEAKKVFDVIIFDSFNPKE